MLGRVSRFVFAFPLKLDLGEMLSLTNRYSRLFLAQFLSRVGVLVLAVIAFGIILVRGADAVDDDF